MTSLPRQLAVIDRLADFDSAEESRHLHALLQAQGLSVTPTDVEEAVAQVDLAQHPELVWADRPQTYAALEARRMALDKKCRDLGRKIPADPAQVPGFLTAMIAVGMVSVLLLNLAESVVGHATVLHWTPRIMVPLMLGAGLWGEVRSRKAYRAAAPQRQQLADLKQARHRLNEGVPGPKALRRWARFPLAVAQVRAWKASPVGLLVGDVERLEAVLKSQPTPAEHQALTDLFTPKSTGTDPA